jgi:hypothetical protein
MDDPIDVTCHRCGREFMTQASTRTTCRNCRAAVTVRRGGSSSQAGVSSGGGGHLAAGLGMIVVLVVVIGSCIWRSLHGGDPWT